MILKTCLYNYCHIYTLKFTLLTLFIYILVTLQRGFSMLLHYIGLLTCYYGNGHWEMNKINTGFSQGTLAEVEVELELWAGSRPSRGGTVLCLFMPPGGPESEGPGGAASAPGRKNFSRASLIHFTMPSSKCRGASAMMSSSLRYTRCLWI